MDWKRLIKAFGMAVCAVAALCGIAATFILAIFMLDKSVVFGAMAIGAIALPTYLFYQEL